jgi:predicted permease
VGRWIHTVPLRVRSLFRRSQVERELDEELRFHMDRLVEEHTARGLSPAGARCAALRAMDGVEQQKERCRDARRLGVLEDLAYDLRYAVRMLRRNPGFTVVVVLSLALGIGANTAIFSAIDAVMLRLLPVRDPQQLVMLTWAPQPISERIVNSVEGINGRVFSSETFEQIRDGNNVFAVTFAFTGNTDEVNVGLEGAAQSAIVQGVSGNYFDGLGVVPIHGRVLQPGDDREAAPPVAVVSHRYWDRKLERDSRVVGRRVVINGAPTVIVGVAPPGFFGLDPRGGPDFWISLSSYSSQQARIGNANNGVPYDRDPQTWWIQIVGRLKAGVSEMDARSQVALLFHNSLDRRAGTVAARELPRLGVFPMKRGLDGLRERFSTSLLLLMAMVSLVLLIACANVAGLLLSRAAARQREIAIRRGLGAGRSRLMRQFLTESVVLAVLGGAAGLLVASWIDSALIALLWGTSSSSPLPFRLDGRVLGFTVAISVLCGILFGSAPALRATSASLLAGLKQTATTARVFGHRLTLQKMLTGGQVAVCLLLLVSAGLLVRTLQKLHSVDLGFERQHLLLFTVRPGMNGYKDAALAGYYQDLRERLAGVPTVRSVSFSSRAPIGAGQGRSGATIGGPTGSSARAELHRHQIGPAYFETLGIPILAGRGINAADTDAAPQVAVINQKLARRYFGNDSPLGHRVNFGTETRPNEFAIVGVVKDAKYNRLRDEEPPTIYLPYRQFLGVTNSMTFEVRADGDLTPLVAAISREVLALDRSVPLVDLKTQDEAVGQTLALERTLATLTTAFGVLALALACVGLYGTMAYSVARRTSEIGVRMALGAESGAILRMVLRETLTMVLTGLGVGVPLALAATQTLRAQLFGLSAHDPATLALAALVVGAVTVAAGYVPARRAARIDPIGALRCE